MAYKFRSSWQLIVIIFICIRSAAMEGGCRHSWDTERRKTVEILMGIHTYVRTFYVTAISRRWDPEVSKNTHASRAWNKRVWKRLRYRAAPHRFVFAARTLRDHISGSVALDIAQTERSEKNVAIREMPVRISEMRQYYLVYGMFRDVRFSECSPLVNLSIK